MDSINLYLLQNLGYNLKQLTIALTVILLLSIVIYCLIAFKNRLISLGILLFIIGILGFLYSQIFINVICLYVLLPSLVLGGLAGLYSLPDTVNFPWDASFKVVKKGLIDKDTRVIKNLRRGTLILGSAGSGKTESPIYSIMKRLADAEFSGVLYDFKDFELTEIAQPLFEERLKIVAIHKPSLSSRINPLSSRFISNVKDINEVVSVLVDNLGSDAKSDFFKENAEALLTSIILKLHLNDKRDRTNYCTLPHVVALILNVDFSEIVGQDKFGEIIIEPYAKLKRFLTADSMVKTQASAFLNGLSSEKQTAAVFSTLANLLRKIAIEEAFYVLGADELDLAVNKHENDIVISVVSEPKNNKFLSPINATIIHTITKQMMVRDRKQSFVLLDEAPTIKLKNMAQLPATMRSFGVCIIYCMQDLSQGIMQYGRDGIKEITSNLSTQFFGKTNDGETSKYYESFFGTKNIKTFSKSFKGGGGGMFGSISGSTEGEREISEVRAIEFFKLKSGQFAFFADGKGEIIQFQRNKIVREKIDEGKISTTDKYKLNYENIIRDVQQIIDTKY